MHTVIWILSAFTAGAVARVTMKGRNRGYLGDVALGLLGSVIGAWILRFLRGEVPPGNVASLVVAFTGAILLVAVGRLVLTVARQTGRFASEVVQGNVLPDLETQITGSLRWSGRYSPACWVAVSCRGSKKRSRIS